MEVHMRKANCRLRNNTHTKRIHALKRRVASRNRHRVNQFIAQKDNEKKTIRTLIKGGRFHFCQLRIRHRISRIEY